MSTIEDSCGTDLERSSSRPGMPPTAASIGTLTSCSTSSAVNPRQAVWISTRGGANSGKTSTDAEPSCSEPSSMTAQARATTMVLNLRLMPMSQRMSVRRIEFCAVQFLGSRGDHHGAGGRTVTQQRDGAVDPLDGDGLADVDPGLGVRVDPGLAGAVVQDGPVGDGQLAGLRIRGGDVGFEAYPLDGALGQGDAVQIRSWNFREDGGVSVGRGGLLDLGAASGFMTHPDFRAGQGNRCRRGGSVLPSAGTGAARRA